MNGDNQVGGWVSSIFVNPVRAYAEWSARATGQVLGTAAGAVGNVGSSVSVLGAELGQGISTASKVIAIFAGAYTLLMVIFIVALVYLVLRHGGKFVKEVLPSA